MWKHHLCRLLVPGGLVRLTKGGTVHVVGSPWRALHLRLPWWEAGLELEWVWSRRQPRGTQRMALISAPCPREGSHLAEALRLVNEIVLPKTSHLKQISLDIQTRGKINSCSQKGFNFEFFY